MNIVEKLCNIIIITHDPLNYILIEDLLLEYEDLIVEKNYNEKKIKYIIYKYLKENVKIKPYSSKVFGKYNKRGYIGIKWKEEYKNKKYEIFKKKHYHFYEHYDLNELLLNKEKTNMFLKKVKDIMFEINWPPINIVFYMNVLVNSLKTEEKEKNISLEYKKELKEEKKDIKSIEKTNKINTLDFIKYLDMNLIETEDKKDIILTEEIIKAYNKNVKIENDGLLKKELRSYILEKFCNNDINILNKKYLYRKEKRGYKYLKLIKDVY